MSPARTLRSDQRCRIFTVDPELSRMEMVFESTEHLYEAPNWSTTGELIVNGDGRLWRVTPTPGSVPERIEIDGVPALNNDHVLAPDGETIYLSADDGHIVETLFGGQGTINVNGWEPNGRRFAYVDYPLD